VTFLLSETPGFLFAETPSKPEACDVWWCSGKQWGN